MTLSVLVVDRDVAAGRSLVERLTELGHTAFSVASAEGALETMFEESIDVLLTDLRLADKDGIELIEMARGASPQARPLVMSAQVSSPDHQTARALGAVDVLTKPFDNDALVSALAEAASSLKLKSGSVHGLGLPQVMQAFLHAKKSKTIEVEDVGRVHLRDGAVVHAEAGEVTGLEALRRLLAATGAPISTATTLPKVPRTIHGRLEYLLNTLAPGGWAEDSPAAAVLAEPEPDPMTQLPTPDLKEGTLEAEKTNDLTAKASVSEELYPPIEPSGSDWDEDYGLEATKPKRSLVPVLVAAAVLVAAGVWIVSSQSDSAPPATSMEGTKTVLNEVEPGAKPEISEEDVKTDVDILMGKGPSKTPIKLTGTAKAPPPQPSPSKARPAPPRPVVKKEESAVKLGDPVEAPAPSLD